MEPQIYEIRIGNSILLYEQIIRIVYQHAFFAYCSNCRKKCDSSKVVVANFATTVLCEIEEENII